MEKSAPFRQAALIKFVFQLHYCWYRYLLLPTIVWKYEKRMKSLLLYILCLKKVCGECKRNYICDKKETKIQFLFLLNMLTSNKK